MSNPGEPLRGDHVTVEALMALEFAAPLPQDIPSLALARRPGVTPTRGAGQGHVIRELRPYADGDDPRFIDAAASARVGSPQLRSFHEDREGNLLLVADFRRPMLWGTVMRLRSVAAAELLMRLGWQAMAAGGAVGLVALSDAGTTVTRPRPRHAGLARVAAHLARAHAEALGAPRHESPPLDQAFAHAMRHAPPGAMVALASGLDEPGPGLHQILAVAARRGPLALFLIEDPLEQSPPTRAMPCHDAEGSRLLNLSAVAAARTARAADLHVPGLRTVRIRADHPVGAVA